MSDKNFFRHILMADEIVRRTLWEAKIILKILGKFKFRD